MIYFQNFLLFTLLKQVYLAAQYHEWPKERCVTWCKKHLTNSTERHYYNLTTPLIMFDNFKEFIFGTSFQL